MILGDAAHKIVNAQLFRVECRVTGLDEALSGEGNSRRRAAQDAAGKALSERSYNHERRGTTDAARASRYASVIQGPPGPSQIRLPRCEGIQPASGQA